MFGVINLYMAMCLCECMAATETSIKWEVKTKYVTYGEDTTLTCNANTCSPNSSKHWIGGPGYNLLCSEDFSANPYKYEMVVESTTPNFDLMIKNFTFSDANCKYTCVCGILQYTKMLILDSLDFIYPPVFGAHFLEANESKLQIDLFMKVYPFPTCTISYQEMNIQVKIKNYTATQKHTACCELYDIRIQHILDMKNVGCSGNVNLTCKVGFRNYLLSNKSIDSCSTVPAVTSTNTHDQFIMKYAIALGVLILVCVTVINIWCKFVERRRSIPIISKGFLATNNDIDRHIEAKDKATSPLTIIENDQSK